MKNYPVELVKEYELALLTCCNNCRKEVDCDDLLLLVDSYDDYYHECPECGAYVDELDKLTLDEYADSLIEKGVKIEDYENND